MRESFLFLLSILFCITTSAKAEGNLSRLLPPPIAKPKAFYRVITEKDSGITYCVESDQFHISAKNRKGDVLWIIDLNKIIARQRMEEIVYEKAKYSISKENRILGLTSITMAAEAWNYSYSKNYGKQEDNLFIVLEDGSMGILHKQDGQYTLIGKD